MENIVADYDYSARLVDLFNDFFTQNFFSDIVFSPSIPDILFYLLMMSVLAYVLYFPIRIVLNVLKVFTFK